MKRVAEYYKNAFETNWLAELHPTTVKLICEFIEYCEEKSLPCSITDTISTLEEDQRLKRVSDTHRTARAFDASIHGWNDTQIQECVAHFNNKYPELGALSQDGKQRRLVYVHDAGTGMHFHFQIRRELALPVLEHL